jgi:hypothetical protein
VITIREKRLIVKLVRVLLAVLIAGSLYGTAIAGAFVGPAAQLSIEMVPCCETECPPQPRCDTSCDLFSRCGAAPVMHLPIAEPIAGNDHVYRVSFYPGDVPISGLAAGGLKRPPKT